MRYFFSFVAAADDDSNKHFGKTSLPFARLNTSIDGLKEKLVKSLKPL